MPPGQIVLYQRPVSTAGRVPSRARLRRPPPCLIARWFDASWVWASSG